MFPLAPFVAVVLAGFAGVAACTDMHDRRIPNWLTAAGVVCGFALNAFLYGGAGLKHAGLGLGLALLIYLPLFILRGMGAGDVKLMASIGALAGPANWLRIFVFTAILGGLIAVVFILYRGALRRAIRNVGRILVSPFRGQAPYHDNPELDVTSGAGLSLPHGAVIALGTYLYVFVTSS
ncbi:MAG: prepilin peptidase [Acidobacteria bacterium]|nr:prepilin peptidase [Acidobacteriota bacterium]